MAHFKRKPQIVEVITFDELVEFGKANGANVVNGMPWSFSYNSFPITHENDKCYLIPILSGTAKMTPDDMLILDRDYRLIVMPREKFNELYEPVKY